MRSTTPFVHLDLLEGRVEYDRAKRVLGRLCGDKSYSSGDFIWPLFSVVSSKNNWLR